MSRSNFALPGVPASLMPYQAPMGTFPAMARSLQVCSKQASTSSAVGGTSRHLLSSTLVFLTGQCPGRRYSVPSVPRFIRDVTPRGSVPLAVLPLWRRPPASRQCKLGLGSHYGLPIPSHFKLGPCYLFTECSWPSCNCRTTFARLHHSAFCER